MLKVVQPTTEQRIVNGFIATTRGLFAGEKIQEGTLFLFYLLTNGQWDDARRVADHLYGRVSEHLYGVR